jgi:hypothetical protein
MRLVHRHHTGRRRRHDPITSVQIPADGTLEVKDSALVTVDSADTFDATVSFSLCGPFDAAATTVCDTGGVAVGCQAVTTSPSTVVSDAATITSAGRYCWRGDFSGDSDVGVPAESDSSEGECFLVTPRTATIITDSTDTVLVGNAINDVATLGNTANQPGSDARLAAPTARSIRRSMGRPGTITFSLYGRPTRRLHRSRDWGDGQPDRAERRHCCGDSNYSASAGPSPARWPRRRSHLLVDRRLQRRPAEHHRRLRRLR